MKMNKVINDNTQNILKEAVDTICNAVKVTLGPKGKNVLTINSYGDAHLTKDGITVAKNVKSDDPIINGIINVVREASNNTAKSAGDGTSSSLVLTQELFNKGLEAINNGTNPTMLKYGMDDALNKVIKFIEDNSEKIDINDDKLFQVAHISANNDTVVGDIAVKAIKSVGIDGIINIEDSPTHDTYVKVTNGFSFDRGYLSPYFSNTGNKITYENPLIFLSEIEISKEVAMSLLTAEDG